jgi:uncharacterized protein (TIGR03437 family)
MKRFLALLCLLALTTVAAIPAHAQTPTILADGVRNGASYALTGMPNSGIAQGAIMVVFGDNLGPANLVQVDHFPLPTAPPGLAGTSVKVVVGGTTFQCIMLYTLKTQVAAVLPSNTTIGTGTLTVTFNGATSATAPITVVSNSFGTFALNQAGSGPGVIQNVNSATDRPFNGLTAAAHSGQTMILWGTGIGPVNAQELPNEAAFPLPRDMPNLNLHVWVGGKDASVAYRGRSGCCVGIDQIVFDVPAGVLGCYVPVFVQIGNIVGNFTSIAVAATGNTCSDPGGFSAEELAAAQANGKIRYGTLSLSRVKFSLSIPGFGTIVQSTDNGSGLFYSYTFAQLQLARGTAPAPGSCFVNTFKVPGDPGDPITPVYLDAGPALNLSGPGGAKQLTKTTAAGTISYSAQLGQSDPLGGAGTLYLSPGNYTYSGTGGSGTNAVGPFQVTHNHVDNFNWTNADAVTAVNRSSGLTVNWTGGDPNGYISIVGSSTNVANNAGAIFACYVSQSLGTFTVPSGILLALPVSGSSQGTPNGNLIVGSISKDTRFTATGIDLGFVVSAEQVFKSVAYQ